MQLSSFAASAEKTVERRAIIPQTRGLVIKDSLPYLLHDILPPMRRLGIDFGTKKVGLALTDEGGSMAFPHSVIPNDSELQKTIERLIEEEKVQEVVIGQSLNLDGTSNPVQRHIESFITDLTLSMPIPIYLEPEQLTSVEAARVTGKNDKIDASAAALILSSFLAKQ